MSSGRGIDAAYPTPAASMTDLYQLTMAYGYWKLGRADQRAVFSLFFRRPPFGSGYAVVAGLERVVEYVESLRFTPAELTHLAELRGGDDAPLFEPAFIEYLADLRLTLDIDAMAEGTVAFAHEPLLRVEGSLLQAQLIETALLNLVNFPTLVATKAARIVQAAAGKPVLEFGLRRAQGPDGALSASRAAYIGGCAATSNVLAGRLFGIPVKGTHAHSWVLSFADERAAFEGYLDSLPNNGALLVDTYDTLEGVGHAIAAARARPDSPLAGIRLDSGDLAYLSQRSRRILDESGFPDAQIVASNDLDEETIEALVAQGATIDVYGVGTKLVTCYDQPALGGVYKLTAIEEPSGWRTPIKVSAEAAKITVPGRLGVRRYYDRAGTARADMIWDTLQEPVVTRVVDPSDRHRRLDIDPAWSSRELLAPVVRDGRRAAELPSLEDICARARQELASLHPSITRLVNPHRYPAGLDAGLHRRRESLIEQALDQRALPAAA